MPPPDSSAVLQSEHASPSACRVADLLLDIGTVLLASGAHSGRVNRNIQRVADAWGYSMDLLITFRGLMVSIKNNANPTERVARFRRTPLHGVHFGVLTEASQLTWRILEQDLAIDEAERQWKQVKAVPHTRRRAMLAGVGAACGCLCLLLEGSNLINGGVTVVAAVSGMVARQEALKLRFNPMIAFIVASFVTTLIAGSDLVFRLGSAPENTLATSVLYLVPGVPLINSAIDVIEGYIPTAMARGVYGGFILLCVAVGMSLAIFSLGIHRF